MKTSVKFFAVALMCFLTLNSVSQGIVIKGGLNLSKWVNFHHDYEDLKRTTGFQAGLLFETPINDKGLVLAPGVFISSKGARDEYNYNEYSSKSSLCLYYLEVPVLFKRYFFIGKVRCFGGIGPFVGFATHGKYKWEETWMGETESDTETISWDDLDGMNRFELGALATLGVELRQFQLAIDYSNGLLHFGEDVAQDEQFLNSVISFTAAYRIPRNK